MGKGGPLWMQRTWVQVTSTARLYPWVWICSPRSESWLLLHSPNLEGFEASRPQPSLLMALLVLPCVPVTLSQFLVNVFLFAMSSAAFRGFSSPASFGFCRTRLPSPGRHSCLPSSKVLVPGALMTASRLSLWWGASK